jgi:hypothetical protein
MNKYRLFASETVYYALVVEAESEDEARELVYDGQIDFDFKDIIEGNDFNLDRVEEIKQ